MLSPAPSRSSSPTTAQTFEVPISSPTIMEEESNMFSLGAKGFRQLRCGRRHGTGFEPAGRDVVADGEVERGDAPFHALAHIVNRPPAPHLPFQIVQTKGH